MNNTKKEYLKGVLLFIGSLIIFIGLSILTFKLKINDDVKILIFILLAIVFIVLALFFKTKIQADSDVLTFNRLKETSDKFVNFKINPYDQKRNLILKNKQYKVLQYEDFYMYYKILRKSDTKLANRGILEAYIFITNPEKDANSHEVQSAINYIEDSLTKKERFSIYNLIVFKEDGPNIDLNEELGKIRFEKHGNVYINLIPIIINNDDKKAFYFNNPTHSPNRYYLNLIENLNKYIR